MMIAVVMLQGCGKQVPEQQAKVQDAKPTTQPPVAEIKQPPAIPKAELTEAKLTPGMVAAKKAHEAGNYREAARLYTVELAAEEAKPAPSWVQLSYLHNQLGLALDNAGLYDKALEHHQKALPIRLKQLGSEHPHVARSCNNIGSVHYKKRKYDKALENYQKALAIQLKKLGPEHPNVARSYNNIGAVHHKKGEYDKALEHSQKALAIQLKQLGPEHPYVVQSYMNMAFVYKAKKDLVKAKEYWEKAYAIFSEKLGPNHPNTKRVKGQLDALKE